MENRIKIETETGKRALVADLMAEQGKKIGITRQAARQIIQKPVGSMKVSSLIKVSKQLGYHLELVRTGGEDDGRTDTINGPADQENLPGV